MLLAAGVLADAPELAAQEYEGETLVTPSLIADTARAVPGGSLRVGVLLEQADGWHTYWRYAGDSGLPTKIEWSLPGGATAGPILWPVPKRIVEPGDLIVFAYKGQVLLMTEITVPEDLTGDSMDIGAEVSWLVCREICIPGKASLGLTLPVGDTPAPPPADHAALFERFQAMLPDATGPPPFSASWDVDDGVQEIRLTGWDPDAQVAFAPLPAEGQLIGHAEVHREDDALIVRLPITNGPQRPVPGVIVESSGDTRRGWTVSAGDTAGDTAAPAAGQDTGSADPRATEPATAPVTPSIGMFLFYGFLGGLILNLMPCVLPVISLKIFGFMKQANEERGRIFRLGLAFCAGVFVWFLGLAGVILALRSAGGEVNWAFQFQNPVFLLVICGLLVVFSLNLFGVFEIVLPGRAASGLGEVAHREGYPGAFAHGLLATILATPCTAPFLGTALGFAFAQPAPVVLAMFTAVATGMALPFFLLSAQPGWMRFLPRPGRWMESLKQFMGFPLLATLVWLLWVLGNQGGMPLVTGALGWLLTLGFGCWLIGRFGMPTARTLTRFTSWSLAIALAVVGWLVLLPDSTLARKPADAPRSGGPAPDTDGIAWIPFSRDEIASQLAKGRPVFIDFTAEWCLTCKFNERAVIDTPEVREVIDRLGIAMLKGDWTNSDPSIGEFLREHGRVGVPFYILYSPANPDDPQPLPELLTKPMLIKAMEKASNA